MRKGIEIYAEEWFMTAGLIGLKRLLGDDLEVTANGVRLTSDNLATLSEKYFTYFLEEYDVAEYDRETMLKNLNQAKQNVDKAKKYVDRSKDYKEYAKQNLKNICKRVGDQFDKIEKYDVYKHYPKPIKSKNEEKKDYDERVKEHFQDSKEKLYCNESDESERCRKLKLTLKNMKSVKIDKNLVDMEPLINDYYNVTKIDTINKKLTLNFVKAMIIAPFYGQPSFLNVSFQENFEEHVQKMNLDYVRPAQLELEFNELLNQKSWEEICLFIERNKSSEPFKQYHKVSQKMSEISKFADWLENNILPCMFIGNIPASISFEEMTFAPLGVSLSNSYNFFWDFQKDKPIPISFLARLILFMIPVGAAIYSRSFQTNDKPEYKQFGGLVLINEHFEEIIKQNNTYRQQRNKNASMNEIITTLFHESRLSAQKVYARYTFVEFHSEIKAKKSLLEYYHMPMYVAKYFYEKSDSLEHLKNLLLQDEFTRTILKGYDPKQTVFKYLRSAIEKRFDAFGAFIATRERARINLIKKGRDELMEKQDKKIAVIQKQGKQIREMIIGKRNNESDENHYQASGEKKITGIAYRLLNAVKAGNNKEFFDTVFRLHISTEQPFSPIFMEANKEEGLDLETIGSAFIAGLLNGYTKDEGKVKNDE